MQRDRLLTHLLSAHSSWNSPARAPQKGHSQGREGMVYKNWDGEWLSSGTKELRGCP